MLQKKSAVVDTHNDEEDKKSDYLWSNLSIQYKISC